MGLWLDRNSDENMGMHVGEWGRSEKCNLNWKEFMRNLLGPWGFPFQISLFLSLSFSLPFQVRFISSLAFSWPFASIVWHFQCSCSIWGWSKQRGSCFIDLYNTIRSRLFQIQSSAAQSIGLRPQREARAILRNMHGMIIIIRMLHIYNYLYMYILGIYLIIQYVFNVLQHCTETDYTYEQKVHQTRLSIRETSGSENS